MKNIRYTKQFKKDLKRYLNQPLKLSLLQTFIDILHREETIPAKYKPHPLKGEYRGCMECHIENDFLLVWYDEENDTYALYRLGTHSELFKKQNIDLT